MFERTPPTHHPLSSHRSNYINLWKCMLYNILRLKLHEHSKYTCPTWHEHETYIVRGAVGLAGVYVYSSTYSYVVFVVGRKWKKGQKFHIWFGMQKKRIRVSEIFHIQLCWCSSPFRPLLPHNFHPLLPLKSETFCVWTKYPTTATTWGAAAAATSDHEGYYKHFHSNSAKN